MTSAITRNSKATEAGIIPDDWDVTTIGAEFEVAAGGDWDAANSSKVRDHAHPYPVFANGLSRDAVQGYCRYFTIPGDSLTITGRGDVGRATYRLEPFVPIVRLLALVAKKGSSAQFFAEYINSQIKFSLESTGVPQLTAPQVRPISIARPSNEEQCRIAEVLSSADEMITSLERLIVKKEAIKQGLMQRLLTGKARLTGFSKPWREVLLGDVSRIKTGARNNQDKKASGRYPFFVRSATLEHIDTYSYDCEAILIPGEGGIGSIFHYINGKFEVHQRVYKISHFDNDVCGRFIYFYMRQFFGAHAMANSVKATVDSLRLPTFRGFHLFIPAEVQEQQGIAEVLDDASGEIDLLRARWAQAKSIKQGMAQELLTGRTRLPVEGRAA